MSGLAYNFACNEGKIPTFNNNENFCKTGNFSPRQEQQFATNYTDFTIIYTLLLFYSTAGNHRNLLILQEKPVTLAGLLLNLLFSIKADNSLQNTCWSSTLFPGTNPGNYVDWNSVGLLRC